MPHSKRTSLTPLLTDVSPITKPASRLLLSSGSDSLPVADPLYSPALVDPLRLVPNGVEPGPGANEDYPIIAVVGPTAAGKSALGLVLAKRLGGEIVNYDSVQVYRGFDIGTGKVSAEDRRGVPHHLLDSEEPDQIFTAGDYCREAIPVLAGIRDRGKLPVLVGGTGLYLRALLLGLFEGPARSENLRARLRVLGERRGREFLHRLLERLDPATAKRVARRDTQKVIRALEVCLLSRRSFSALLARGRTGLRGFQVFKIGLNPDRAELYQRINRRVENMFAAGLLEETRAHLKSSVAARARPLAALGYRQACAALRGEMSIEEAVRTTQAATRRYAKRQLTWFRHEVGVAWFGGFGDDSEIQHRVLDFLRCRVPVAQCFPR